MKPRNQEVGRICSGMKESILITGNAGHIGSQFSNWVLRNHPQFAIVGIDSLLGGFIDNISTGIIFYQRDLSKDNISDIFAKHNIKYVFHFAAYAAEGISPFQRRFVLSNNILSTSNIINECINFGVKRLVYTSSMSVYGNGYGKNFREEDIPAPIDPYAISKLTSELDIKSAGMQHGLEWCILRPHNVYGIGQNIWDKYRNVFGIWMYQTINGLPITIYGDGLQVRAFSYVDDCLPCIWNASVCKEASKQIINLGGKRGYSIKDAAYIFSQITGNTNVVFLEPRYEAKWSIPSWEKSEVILDFKDTTSLETGVQKMWEWAKIQPKRERHLWNKF